MIGSGRSRRGVEEPQGGRARSAEPWALPRPGPPSAFGVLAASSGTSLLTSKEMLVAFSHAIEDECTSGMSGGHLFGAFQRADYYRGARDTWAGLAESAHSAYVFADFGAGLRAGRPVEVDLDPDSPFHREWAVVVDRPHGAVALAARERPDQGRVADEARLFDSAWTTDRGAVRRVALMFARTAHAAGEDGAEAVVYELTLPPVVARDDSGLRERLLDRLLEIVDS